MENSICFTGMSPFTGQRLPLSRSPRVCHRQAPSRGFLVRRVRAAATDQDSTNPTIDTSAAAAESEAKASLSKEDAVEASVTEEKDAPAVNLYAGEVPGKIQLDEIELARQKNALDKYAAELYKKRMQEEYEASRKFGWVPYAETLNGRLAMFFIITGLLTEYWTDYSFPEQVELLLRTLGVL